MNTLLTKSFILAATMEPRLFDLDLQLIADAVLMMIAIFALFVAMSHIFFNPARKILQDRQTKIKDELDNAKKDMDDAALLKSEYEAKLKDINKEAEEILSEARKIAVSNENKIIATAKREAANIIERATVEARLEQKKVVDEVKTEMISIASIMAGKVVSASIDTTIQDSLINETLKEIGEGTWLS